MLTLTNAKLFDGTKMLPGRRSVSINGKACISAVGEQPMSSGGETIDVAGMTLMPGMITGIITWIYGSTPSCMARPASWSGRNSRPES